MAGLSFGAVVVLLLVFCGTVYAQAATVDGAFYMRSDTNDTVVYAPRVHVAGKLGESAGLEATYAIDSWTGASIDVVTAATSAIHEVRREVQGGGYYAFKHVKISGSYRYSGENDYWSNGGVVNLTTDLADKNTTLMLSVLGSADTVARASDVEGTKKATGSLGARFTLTQILDAKTVLQLSAEVVRLSGFLSSYYRYVGFRYGGLCYGSAVNCIQESHPHERLRSALGLHVRRAIGKVVSLALDVRHYFDDWGIRSETAAPEVSVLVGEHGLFSVSYRFYTQTQADFYRPRYLQSPDHYAYFTRDRKLSPMGSQRLGLEYVHALPAGKNGEATFELGARAGGTYLHYRNFVGLSNVLALELTGLLGLAFR